jgi:hypothetical protein
MHGRENDGARDADASALVAKAAEVARFASTATPRQISFLQNEIKHLKLPDRDSQPFHNAARSRATTQ